MALEWRGHNIGGGEGSKDGGWRSTKLYLQMRGGHIIQRPEEEELLVEAEVRESQIACPTGWFPSKISTMLAFNIISHSMPN